MALRLAPQATGGLADNVVRYGYDRASQDVGIVHFGIGAFHRAHQAWYTDLAMDGGCRDWAVTGVSLRSGDVGRQLNPQDGLYTVTERSGAGSHTRLIGAVREVLIASKDGEAVVARLAAPGTHIASLTITEKGYCRAADGSLDPALADEGSVFAFLARGLRRRHDAGLPGLTLLSCDNLADNGGQLARLMTDYLDRTDPALRRWFEGECACPSTTVDRIVPATTPEDRNELADRIGLVDEAAVVTEPFSQWVIEDRFAGPRPAWERCGAELTADVRPYGTAKLRMLNGAHSALAYIGLCHGHSFVHEAMADPAIRPIVERLMREEAAGSIIAAPGQHLAAYADALIARFCNPALNHRLIQIAMDGSEKLPQRWLETLAENQRKGRSCPAILAGLAAWLRHVRGDNGPVDDPGAEALMAIWGKVGEAGIVQAVFGEQGMLGSIWTPRDEDIRIVTKALGSQL